MGWDEEVRSKEEMMFVVLFCFLFCFHETTYILLVSMTGLIVEACYYVYGRATIYSIVFSSFPACIQLAHFSVILVRRLN